MKEQEFSAVVTGASRSIGRAIAWRMHESGYAVVINYQNTQEAADTLREEIIAAGGRALCYQADVADMKQAEGLIEAAEAFAPIGALVNNAGITKDGLLMRMSHEDFTHVLDVNLIGAFHTIRCASPAMLRRRSGTIVNISSVVGVMGNAGQGNYAAAKAGLIGLTKSVAREMASRGVTVNAVLPGYIETDMTAVMPDAVKEKFLARIPLGRPGTVREVAEMVAFLCSENSRYITGHSFFVDGGLAM